MGLRMQQDLKILGVYVSTDNNLMYIVYDDESAIAFDATNTDVLVHSLSINPSKTIMTKAELFNCPKVSGLNRELLAVFTTHHHWDHSSGNTAAREICKNVFDKQSLEEKEYVFKNFTVKALSTPCHTRDSFSFLIDKYLILGDTLLYLGCGKFFEGTGSDMEACFEKLREHVPPETICCYGHDYATMGYKFANKYFDVPTELKNKKLLTFGEELEYNPFINYKKLVEKGVIKDLNNLRNIKNHYKGD